MEISYTAILGIQHYVQKLESVQYKACLAITGCFRGTARESYTESLADRSYSFYIYVRV